MSSRYIETHHEGRPVEVLLGWNHPMCCYFMQVYTLDEDGNHNYIYNNLDDAKLRDAKADYLDQFEYFKRKINHMGIKVPDKIWSILYNDMEEGLMDSTYYDVDGNLLPGSTRGT